MKRAFPLVFAMLASTAYAGDLPDPDLTPGVTDPQVTDTNIKESICKETHFTWTEGHAPTQSYIDKVEATLLSQYGYEDMSPQHYQLDHLIPLSLGGHPTDVKNLWPQVLITQWSARRKDYLEQTLHNKVCKGQLGLKEAQDMIRTNWIEAYKKFLGDTDRP